MTDMHGYTPVEILGKTDHTCLRQDATWNDIKTLCDDAVLLHTASVCIPPSYVKKAFYHLSGQKPVCTVIGFPNGYMTRETKTYEAADAVRNGAEEIDMVINLGWVKNERFDKVLDEIRSVREVTGGKILKVIVETCLLTESEKIRLCEVVGESGADFIKTSTGFSSGGATVDDVKLFKANIPSRVRIKAAGGIKTLDRARELLEAGASRIGASRLVEEFRKIGADAIMNPRV